MALPAALSLATKGTGLPPADAVGWNTPGVVTIDAPVPVRNTLPLASSAMPLIEPPFTNVEYTSAVPVGFSFAANDPEVNVVWYAPAVTGNDAEFVVPAT